MNNGISIWLDLLIALAGFGAVAVATWLVIQVRSVPGDAVRAAEYAVRGLRERVAAGGPDALESDVVTEQVRVVSAAAAEVNDPRLSRICRSLDRSVGIGEVRGVEVASTEALRRIEQLQRRHSR